MKAKKKFQAKAGAATRLALPEAVYQNDSADIQLLEAVKRPKEYSWAITNQTVAVNNNHIYMNMPVSTDTRLLPSLQQFLKLAAFGCSPSEQQRQDAPSLPLPSFYRGSWRHSYIQIIIHDVTGPPDGRRLDVVVGAGHDVDLIRSTSIKWGSWDPNGSYPPINSPIEG